MNRPFTLRALHEGFTQSVLCEGPTIRHWPLRFPRRPSTLVLRIFTLSIEGRAVTFAARVRRFLSRPAPLLTPSNLCAFPRPLREESSDPPQLPSCRHSICRNSFGINTCKSVSKQRPLSPLEATFTQKPGEGGMPCQLGQLLWRLFRRPPNICFTSQRLGGKSPWESSCARLCCRPRAR
jgi:hypothetical protein